MLLKNTPFYSITTRLLGRKACPESVEGDAPHYDIKNQYDEYSVRQFFTKSPIFILIFK
jgi:hypothetical protein